MLNMYRTNLYRPNIDLYETFMSLNMIKESQKISYIGIYNPYTVSHIDLPKTKFIYMRHLNLNVGSL